MSNDVSGPFKTYSGPPYVYEVSITYDNYKKQPVPVPEDAEEWLKILDNHASNLNIPFKGRITENGYNLAFLKHNDYERLLESIDTEAREHFDFRTQRIKDLIKRYSNNAPNNGTPSVDRS
ncbi:MAG: hypothetical protein GY941_22650 [Planctomycetes bacterium]|nr:hypothetical protein [Planctomycetota bacterium]